MIARVGISLPCSVPVIPGTPDTDAPIGERTELCHVDAWWFVVNRPVCDLHLRVLLGDDYEQVVDEVCEGGWKCPNGKELLPWAEMHRYPQEATT